MRKKRKYQWKPYFATVCYGFHVLAVDWEVGWDFSITICNLVFGIEKV